MIAITLRRSSNDDMCIDGPSGEALLCAYTLHDGNGAGHGFVRSKQTRKKNCEKKEKERNSDQSERRDSVSNKVLLDPRLRDGYSTNGREPAS